MIVQFATQAYQSHSLPVAAQRLVNAHAEQQPPDAKTQVAVFGSPGISQFANTGTGPIRGMRVMDGVLYVLSGTQLYRVTSAGVSTELGGAISGSGVVSMSDNGSQLVIVNGTTGHVYSVASGFQRITDTNFLAAKTVTFIDQFFAFDRTGEDQWFISNVSDGSAYTSTDITTAESNPDTAMAVINHRQTVLVFCEHSTEVYQNAGAANFPFLRAPGGTIDRGLAGSYALCKEDNTVFWLGDDWVFYRLDGVTPKRLSTHALEHEWQNYSTVSDAFCFSYPFDGHKFVAITFPTANKTFVFDIATGLWHERESWDQNNSSLGRWRINCAVQAYNQLFVGDAFTGKIGYFNNTVETEFGSIIRLVMTSPPIHRDRKTLHMPSFEIDLESGVGTASGQGLDPQAMMDYSDDGGRTFNGPEQWAAIGATGAYTTRVRWTQLGSFRNRIMRLTVSDPVRRGIIAAHANLVEGM